jgi:hypothetical protein
MFNFDNIHGIGEPSGDVKYANLPDKPQINSVTLVGNKSLDDLGIQAKGDYALNTEVNNKLSEKLSIDVDNISDTGKQNILTIVGKETLDNEITQLNTSMDTMDTELSQAKADIIQINAELDQLNPSEVIASEKYGIKGDYSTQYGILECPNGILKNTSDKEIVLQQGVVLQCAGQDSKTTIATAITHTVESNTDIDIFYAGGQLLECGDVFYQINEPDNGVSNFVAWWNPEAGVWKFKSNDTGNVFREAVACRIAHLHCNENYITRIDYIGNRILDDECFITQEELSTLQISGLDTPDKTIIGAINGIDTELATKADINQLPATTSLLQGSSLVPISTLATDATLAEAVQKINEVIAILVSRGVARNQVSS